MYMVASRFFWLHIFSSRWGVSLGMCEDNIPESTCLSDKLQWHWIPDVGGHFGTGDQWNGRCWDDDDQRGDHHRYAITLIDS